MENELNKLAAAMRDMSDMVGDHHWQAAKAIEQLARIKELESQQAASVGSGNLVAFFNCCKSIVERLEDSPKSAFSRLRDAVSDIEQAASTDGQEPVAMLRYARGVPGFENEMPHVVSCSDMPDGLYPVYLTPPAQASAWVAVSERLPEHNQWVLIAWRDQFKVGQFKSNHPFSPAVVDHMAGKYWSFDTWQPITAPTPGASDGKELMDSIDALLPDKQPKP